MSELQGDDPVQIVDHTGRHVLATGYFYAKVSDTQIAVRSSADPSMIGVFASEKVVRAS